jgi:hypothetical protein
VLPSRIAGDVSEHFHVENDDLAVYVLFDRDMRRAPVRELRA